MTLETIVANAVLECKYNYDVATQMMIASLYQRAIGKRPPAKLNVLRWFFKTYEFNITDDTWYHRERITIH